ncbi:hypothetical protein ABPG72_020692 [Tetrahymena utriculariae]
MQTKRANIILSQISNNIKDEVKEDLKTEIQQRIVQSQNNEKMLNDQTNQSNKQKSLKINEEDCLQTQYEETDRACKQKSKKLTFLLNQMLLIINTHKKKKRKQINRSIKIKFMKTFKNFRLHKKENYLESLGLDKQAIQFIEKQVDDITDFSKIIEELAFLKKAIMIILYQDQLATLKLVGCLKEFIKYLNNANIENSKMSYFEEYFDISLQIDKQIDFMKQFITKCQTQNNLSIINQRINSSIK